MNELSVERKRETSQLSGRLLMRDTDFVESNNSISGNN